MSKYSWKPPVHLQDGEPWFFIRAQDELAINGVVGYAEGLAAAIHIAEQNGDEAKLNGLRILASSLESLYEAFMDWQEENADLVKTPD